MSWSLLGVTGAVSPPKLVLVNTWPQSRHRGYCYTAPANCLCHAVSLHHTWQWRRPWCGKRSTHWSPGQPQTSWPAWSHPPRPTSGAGTMGQHPEHPEASEAPTPAWPIIAWLRPRHWPGPATPEPRWPDPDSVCGQTQTVENVWLAPSLVSTLCYLLPHDGAVVTKLSGTGL